MLPPQLHGRYDAMMFGWRTHQKQQAMTRFWLPIVAAIVAALAEWIAVNFGDHTISAYVTSPLLALISGLSAAVITEMLLIMRSPTYEESVYGSGYYGAWTSQHSQDIAKSILYDPEFKADEEILTLIAEHIKNRSALSMEHEIFQKHMKKFIDA